MIVLTICMIIASLLPAAAGKSLSWRLAAVDADCDTTCEAVGGLCDDSAWPTTLEQWQAMAGKINGLSCRVHMVGTWKYNPAICTSPSCQGICFWQGAGSRCSGGMGEYPSPIAKRACPCKSMMEAETQDDISSTPYVAASSDTIVPVYSMIGEHSFQGHGECFDADVGAGSELPLAGSAYTIEAWVQPQEVQEYESFGIVGWGTTAYSQLNGLIFFRGSHSLRNIWWQNDLQAYLEKPLADGRYHHVAATWDGSMQKIIVDFQEVASRSAQGYSVQSTINFCVGVAWHQDGSRASFKGNIKGLKVWNFARTANDMEADQNIKMGQTRASVPVIASAIDTQGAVELNSSHAAKPIIIESFEPLGSRAYFNFDVPSIGCYMIEERHPQVVGKTVVPISVNYGKGLQAHGEVDYADGWHEQWNYLASLPFFANHPAGVVAPLDLSAESNAHAFRFSHIGPSCRSVEAQVQHAELEVKADLVNMVGREVAFKANLGALLTSSIELSPGRLSVTHVSSVLIKAEIMIRPSGTFYGRRLKEDLTAVDIVSLLKTRLQSDAAVGPDSLSTRICKLVGRISGCAVAIKALGVMTPHVHFGVMNPEPQRKSPSNLMAIVIASCVALVVFGSALCIVVLFWRRQAKRIAVEQTSEGPEPETKAHEKTDEAGPIIDETASTATPTSLADLENQSELSADV